MEDSLLAQRPRTKCASQATTSRPRRRLRVTVLIVDASAADCNPGPIGRRANAVRLCYGRRNGLKRSPGNTTDWIRRPNLSPTFTASPRATR